MLEGFSILAVGIFVLALLLVVMGVKTVPQGNEFTLERFGRYSFIGLPARTRIRVRGHAVEVEDDSGVIERHQGDPQIGRAHV